ncbi:hypothetical protein KR51_00008720 [Rubidibacter lacunae KORDI 51-2]|uniref:Uncharacterized protein n=1 Tax=Rubidibacter lacunae KORDI 51-2 TaxID=582515 RepID=U5DS98_9CHRO|nr:hypothetical protein [Rubidibacter lacunae]ERN42550.1 hypothetical protein KR51_00008720 [Rubidibacter lacunae KORDI 51-2]
MNSKRILFSGLMTALIGFFLLIFLYKVATPPYKSQVYQRLQRVYGIVGAAGGFVFGMSQEALRQMKKQQDEEERARARNQEEGKPD